MEIELRGFTFESQLIATSVCILTFGAVWCAWRCCFERNGKGNLREATSSIPLPTTSVMLATVGLLLLVGFASISEVRQMIPPGAVPVALVLGAAVLIPFSFTSLVFREAASNPQVPAIPDIAATTMLIRQRRSIFPKVSASPRLPLFLMYFPPPPPRFTEQHRGPAPRTHSVPTLSPTSTAPTSPPPLSPTSALLPPRPISTPARTSSNLEPSRRKAQRNDITNPKETER